ncbi:hypothetical protein F5Y11DRAFT_315774 [Daldinia sp. FL1419]|nr:hypothetical protein F5Y11DRAFT_315774 [Daldinia sp. FL1419]
MGCRCCAILSQVNYKCGHQLLLFNKHPKFCLFYPHKKEDFHLSTITYGSQPLDKLCAECALRIEAKEKNIHGQGRLDYVRKRYPESDESYSRAKAQRFLAAARDSQKGVGADRTAELTAHAKAQIKYYLEQVDNKAVQGYQLGVLLKTILQVPVAIDRRDLVITFGSYLVWDQQTHKRKIVSGKEISMLKSIARKANLLKALETGMKSNPFSS